MTTRPLKGKTKPHRCKKLTLPGTPFCRAHDPAFVAAMAAKTFAQVEERRKALVVQGRIKRAAPELLEALEAILDSGLLQGQYEIHDKMRAQAHAAIAKAKGAA